MNKCKFPEFRVGMGCTKCLSKKDCEIYKHLFGTPTELQHGREPEHTCNCETCVKSRTPKPLAQYLSEYIEHEYEHGEGYSSCFINSYPDGSVNFDMGCLEVALEQALDAYESTEQVKIRIERV